MKVLLTGGGTGGHITPILAVAEELRKRQSSCEIIYVGERGAKFAGLIKSSDSIDVVKRVHAGKFRRYDGVGLLSKLLDFKTMLLNLRDVLLVMVGTLQAVVLVGRLRPDVIFLKGGYVGVPVGFAGALWRVPMVTHDSDAIPGLANRIVGRWAKHHAVAADPATYPYPAEHTTKVGVLVEQAYKRVSPKKRLEYKHQINIPKDTQLLLVTGGSLGAVAINEAVASFVERLLADYADLWVVHQVGKGKAGSYRGFVHQRLIVLEFLKPMASYTGAADLVVCRGSANTLAELGVQGKAVIAVPSPYLANGHQMRNADILEEQGSAVVVPQATLYDSQHGLEQKVRELLDNATLRDKLGKALQEQYPVDAAKKVADILVSVARKETG